MKEMYSALYLNISLLQTVDKDVILEYESHFTIVAHLHDVVHCAVVDSEPAVTVVGHLDPQQLALIVKPGLKETKQSLVHG